MMKRLILGTSAAAIVAVSVIAGVTAAGAASALKLGSDRPDDQAAQSNQDSSSLETHELKCPAGYYVAGVEAVETTWGLYPSIEQVSLNCRSIEDKTETQQVSWPDKLYVEGTSFGSPDYIRDQDCAGEGGFVTGLKTDHDAFIKDLQLRCGEKRITSQKVKIDNRGFSGDWLFDRTEPNDDEASLVCNESDRVVTGMRLRYKEDSDEIALTRVQIYCSPLQLK